VKVSDLVVNRLINGASGGSLDIRRRHTACSAALQAAPDIEIRAVRQEEMGVHGGGACEVHGEIGVSAYPLAARGATHMITVYAEAGQSAGARI